MALSGGSKSGSFNTSSTTSKKSGIAVPARRDSSSTSTSSPMTQPASSEQKKKKCPDLSSHMVVVDSEYGAPSNSTSHRDLKQCPCRKSTSSSSWLIDCSRCHQYWHIDCVGLTGLSKGTINKLVDYLCPFCYVPPIPVAPFDVDVCYVCRNTLTLQKANSQAETIIAAEKLQTISDFNELVGKIDFESVKNSLNAVQDLDLHVQHLLLNKDDLKSHQKTTERIESCLSKIAEKLDSETSSNDSIKSLSESIQHLHDQIDAFSNRPVVQHIPDSSATDHVLEAISKQLTELCERPQVSAPPPPPCLTQTLPSPPKLIRPEHHMAIHSSKDNFIDTDLELELIAFFDSCKDKFKSEGDRQCMTFGEQYKYTGSRSSATPQLIPPVLQSLMDKVNSEYCTEGQPQVNSCLINRFIGPDSSLPMHSDNELTIHPESFIHTISLGASCTVSFVTTSDDSETHTHVCQPRSIYSMTRQSQEFFRHGISKGSIRAGTRYSITFRSVSFKNRNSTCILGDSNTCGLKFGVNPKNSFGSWMPGKQIFTPVISDIDPYQCCGYKNVVIHCAINDLKSDEVKNMADIRRLFSLYVNKIECIQAVNPKVHVYVCPPLPSKRAELNKKSLYFIRLMREELLPSNFGVTFVDGFDGFLDQAGLLSQHLSKDLNRYQKPDYLHLNWKGIAKLGVLIRNTVLLRMNGGNDRRSRRSRTPWNNKHPSTGEAEGYAGAAANGFSHNRDGYQSS